MTNTKPTWEDEFDKKFSHESNTYFDCEANNTYSDDMVEDPMKCNCELKDIKAFIQEVHDEAYERGYNDGVDFLNYSIALPKINKL